jgi:hypothetical protein
VFERDRGGIEEGSNRHIIERTQIEETKQEERYDSKSGKRRRKENRKTNTRKKRGPTRKRTKTRKRKEKTKTYMNKSSKRVKQE